MNQSFLLLAFLIVALVGLTACGNDNATANDDAVETEYQPTDVNTPTAYPTESQVAELADEDYIISNNSLYGIKSGMTFAEISNKVKSGTLRNGEGEFSVYYISDGANEPLGYILPDPNDESRVGDIVITSPKVRSKNGFGVGSTFVTLQTVFPKLKVHGSEVESRTYAKPTENGIQYRLDAAFNTYEVDKSKIDPATKVTEIYIPRK